MSHRKSRRQQARHHQGFTTVPDNDTSQSKHFTVEVQHRHDMLNASSDGRTRIYRNRFFGMFQALTDQDTWRRLGIHGLAQSSSNKLIDVDILDYDEELNQSIFGFEPLDPIWNDSSNANDTDPANEPKKKKSRPQPDNPLKEWVENDRERDLLEILRLDGRGDYKNTPFCHGCNTANAEYRCLDCDQIEMFCAQCAARNHTGNPLHCIERWNGLFFERSSLKALGLRVQLGHMTGHKCLNPRRSPGDSFVVVDSNGIHDIALDFCDCESAQPHAVQLLRLRWFPSTGTYPRTASTFRVLKRFHLAAFESKFSSYEFYNSLARNTDNTGLYTEKDRYDEFMRTYRKWTNLTMAKRAARGHDINGLGATKPGECALLCPACPQPGKNLPDGWENEPPEKGWIYGLFLAIDANFRLTRRHVSSEERDPALADGWAFFVENAPYVTHLKNFWHIKQPKSTCVNHEACNNSEKEVQGKSVTGGGTADCARHNFKRPLGFGDLQKGERYLNMDYIFFSSIRNTTLRYLFASYDIACQWYKNVYERLKILPPSLRLSNSINNVAYLVPKFHISAHIQECLLNFSFNTTRYVGRTDGEAPERGWSGVNALATSTREMGPGNCRDTLDDHFNDWNWKKITGLGASLLKKIKAAVPEATDHTLQLRQFEKVVPTEDLKIWTRQVELWENDNTLPNPFRANYRTVSEKEVRLALAENATEDVVVHSNVHPSILITQGLHLEENQRKLARNVRDLGQHATLTQMRVVQEASNRLRRQITSWIELQTLYMPHTAALRQKDAMANSEGIPSVRTEKMPLYLPSALSEIDPCDKSLRIFEWKLRQGQAFDALHEMRQNLRVGSHYIKHKKRFSRGVAQNTRSNTTIQNLHTKAKHAAEKYQIAQAAMVSLAPYISDEATPGWENDLRPLRDEDVRSLSEGRKGESEGKRTVSWIWLTEGMAVGNTDERLHEGELNCEFRCCRAMTDLIDQHSELSGVKPVHEQCWHADWWRERGGILEHVDEISKEGLEAYRQRQASLRLSLRDRFKANWKDVDLFVQMGKYAIEMGEDDDVDVSNTIVQSSD
ncbi:hypothetical protein CVT25_008232 [Psilocybe cyanescens]|uniref:CxC2-like cysteine cluster KDZ transposase-associated domain-containing protein n=1 Tax=Psilocybe cyanescens TaxID=93625 RepID=A0A409XG83_PSICY|nr:hypothetical protein CVT25_008232 [Psilocybe cyanescens]